MKGVLCGIVILKRGIRFDDWWVKVDKKEENVDI